MAKERMRILSREAAVQKKMSSQGCPVYFLVYEPAFGGGIFDVLPHKILGRPGGHIGDEAYHVMKGTLRVYLPDFHTIKTVRATETLYMPAKTTHAPYNPTDDEVSVFTCSGPIDPSKDYHYSQNLPEIMTMQLEDHGQQRTDEPRVFSMGSLIERRKGSRFVHEVFRETRMMMAGALIVAPGEGVPAPIQRPGSTMAYVVAGQAKVTDTASKSQKTVKAGEVLYIAPGTTFTLENEGTKDLQIYYASAAG